MSKCITAHTNPGSDYPGYINFTREDDGSVSVYLRGDPSRVDGIYICGHMGDKGKPGRCTPGDEHCNNYCNLAPQNGPMQKSALPCTQIHAGADAKLTLSAADFDVFLAEAARDK
jgi:hypothetical protein